MAFSPILAVHVCSGALSLLFGSAAMVFRKGSRRHRVSGNIFVISMLGLSTSGAYLGFTKHQTLNGLMGALTFYLVATAWATARRRDMKPDLFDWGALLVAVAVTASLAINGVGAASTQTGNKDGYPAAAYFVFGSWALLFAAGDVRMLVRGGLSGARRIARHLGRMCFALFIATASFFLGQQQVFPEWLRKSNLLVIPALLPLVLMVFWIVRVRTANRSRAGTSPRWEEKLSAPQISRA